MSYIAKVIKPASTTLASTGTHLSTRNTRNVYSVELVVKNKEENKLTGAKEVDLFIDVDFLCSVIQSSLSLARIPVNFGATQ